MNTGGDATESKTMDIISRKDAKAQGLKHYFTGKPCKYGHIALRQTVNSDCTDCLKAKLFAKRGYEVSPKAIAKAARDKAIAEGKTHYFTGIPCARGGIAPRRVSDWSCTCRACTDKVVEKNNRLRHANPEKTRAYRRRYYHENENYRVQQCVRTAARSKYKYDNNINGYRDRMNELQRIRWHKKYGIDPKFTAAVKASSSKAHAFRQSAKAAVKLTRAEQKQVKLIYMLAKALTERTGVIYEVDHHIPLRRGGLHHPDNLWVITRTENRRKYAKLPSEINPAAA